MDAVCKRGTRNVGIRLRGRAVMGATEDVKRLFASVLGSKDGTFSISRA
jgi:hypothetical protein